MLTEASVRFDTIDHDTWFNDHLRVYACVCIGDLRHVERQQGVVHPYLRYVEDIGPRNIARQGVRVKPVIRTRRNSVATCKLIVGQRCVEQQTALANKAGDTDYLYIAR